MQLNSRERVYAGIDVGGTKIQAALATESGLILTRSRTNSPRGDGGALLKAIGEALREALTSASMSATDIGGVGIACCGTIDLQAGRLIYAPNLNLRNVDLTVPLSEEFDLPVAIGNDTNMGALGEKWLGAGRDAKSLVGMFVGTGIGGGFVYDRGKVLGGYRGVAMEIGHVILNPEGPKCSCGQQGCFEAFASRTAIEREIRQAVKAGKKSVVTELLGGDLSRIRSGVLRKALDQKDGLVERVMRRAAEYVGCFCINIRHLVDPEVIVIGGGVFEACGSFLMPIVEEVASKDVLSGAREGGYIRLSALGDDAVVLGAIALARGEIGRSPFVKRFNSVPPYPQIDSAEFGSITVGRKVMDQDVVIRVNGKVKKRKKSYAKKVYGTGHVLGAEELSKICRGGPEVLFVGTGQSGQVTISKSGEDYLRRRAIACCAKPTPEIVAEYNASKKRKAAIIHVTC